MSSDDHHDSKVELTFQEVSVLLALLDILSLEDQSPEVVRLAGESQALLRNRADEARTRSD